jgi:UPF0716 family protein affecting phage T7 exclusion
MVLVGLLAMWWAAALAAFLVMECDNKFRLGTAPSLRCLQPMAWQVAGLVLCLGGVVSAAGGIVSRMRR